MAFEALKKMYQLYADYQTKAAQKVVLHDNLSYVDTIRKNYTTLDASHFSNAWKKTLQRAIDIGYRLDPTTLNIDLALGSWPDARDQTNFSNALFLTNIFYNDTTHTDLREKFRDHGIIDLACGNYSYPQVYKEYFDVWKKFADYKPKFWIGVDKYAEQYDAMDMGFRFIQDDMIHTLRLPWFPPSNIIINGFDLYVSQVRENMPNAYMALLMLEMSRIVPQWWYVFCSGTDLYSDLWSHIHLLTLEDFWFTQITQIDGSKPSIQKDWLGKFLYQKN